MCTEVTVGSQETLIIQASMLRPPLADSVGNFYPAILPFGSKHVFNAASPSPFLTQYSQHHMSPSNVFSPILFFCLFPPSQYLGCCKKFPADGAASTSSQSTLPPAVRSTSAVYRDSSLFTVSLQHTVPPRITLQHVNWATSATSLAFLQVYVAGRSSKMAPLSPIPPAPPAAPSSAFFLKVSPSPFGFGLLVAGG